MYLNVSIYKEERISHWENEKLKKSCKIHSTQLDNGDYRFTIRGYNPLPCKAFEGAYSILYQWLKANGWEHNTKEPDIIIVTNI